jgi:hypothetical protein
MTATPKEMAAALITPDMREYWEALGRFVDIFALVENNMQLTLWHLAKVKAPIAPAIFSGTRVDTASNLIRRISEAKEWSQRRQARLTTLLTQLGEITRARNDLLHYGSLRSESGYEVTNLLYAHIPARIRTTKISRDILDAMADDLMTICVELMDMRGAMKAFRSVRKGRLMPPKRAWRYKPERQQGAAQKPPRTPRKRSRPRRSSRA